MSSVVQSGKQYPLDAQPPAQAPNLSEEWPESNHPKILLKPVLELLLFVLLVLLMLFMPVLAILIGTETVGRWGGQHLQALIWGAWCVASVWIVLDAGTIVRLMDSRVDNFDPPALWISVIGMANIIAAFSMLYMLS